MNPIEEHDPDESRWEPITKVVFYQPRTIPSGWDLSEYLPGHSIMHAAGQLTPQED
jgi:hypothetical protein